MIETVVSQTTQQNAESSQNYHPQLFPLEDSTVITANSRLSPSMVDLILVWPFPWRYPLPRPSLSVEEIEKHPGIIDEHQSGIRQIYNIPIYRARDILLRSLYRLFRISVPLTL